MNRIHLRLLGLSLTAEGVIAVLLAALIALVVVAQLRRDAPFPAPTHPAHTYPGSHGTSNQASEVDGYPGCQQADFDLAWRYCREKSNAKGEHRLSAA